jgi:hypothetical protein
MLASITEAIAMPDEDAPRLTHPCLAQARRDSAPSKRLYPKLGGLRAGELPLPSLAKVMRRGAKGRGNIAAILRVEHKFLVEEK